MNSFRISLFALTLCALPALSQPIFAQDVAALTKEFRGETPPQARTQEESAAAYARVLAQLLPDMASADVAKQGAAIETWQSIAWRAARPGAENERVAVAEVTASQLGPEVPIPARLALLQMLERIGAREAVPALTKALADQNALIREGARRALQSNPAGEAGIALRQALQNAKTPEARIAFLNALGNRREAASVSDASRFALDSDAPTAQAAIGALGKIGGSEAVRALQNARANASASTREEIADALLRAAERFLAEENREAAGAIYNSLYLPTEMPTTRVAALRGLVLARGDKATPLLFAALTGSDAPMQKVAGRFVSELPGSETTRAFAALLPKLPADSQITLLDELGARGDVAARPTVLNALRSSNSEVRIAAFGAMAQLGDATNAMMLARLATSGKGRERKAAREAVAGMRGSSVNSALLHGVKARGTSPKLRAELIRTLAARRFPFAVPTLLRYIDSRDAETQSEAIRALGILGDQSVVPALATLIVEAPQSAVRNAATQSLAAFYDRNRSRGASSQPIIALLPEEAPAHVALLGVLRHAADEGALESVRAALLDSDAEVQGAAVRALSEWPDALPLNDLLVIARDENNKTTQRVLALRGYARLTALGEFPAAERVRLLQLGMIVAERAEEKRLFLGALGEIADALAVRAAAAFLDDATLGEEAAVAILSGARKMEAAGFSSSDVAVVRPILLQLTSSQNADSAKSAAQLLSLFDEQASRIWLACGPFPTSAEEFGKAFAPEQEIDLAARYDTQVGGNRYVATWREIKAKGHLVDFADFFQPNSGGVINNASVYALGYVYSPTARTVKMGIGSDDGIRIWVNDELAFSHQIDRGAALDQEIVDARLRAGWNKVLIKLVNTASNWQFFFRVADENMIAPSDLKFRAQPPQTNR